MTTTTDGADVAPTTSPGRAAAPAGPVDLLPMYLMHHAFRRDLSAFAGRGGIDAGRGPPGMASAGAAVEPVRPPPASPPRR